MKLRGSVPLNSRLIAEVSMETYELGIEPSTEVTDQIETRQVLEATWLIVIAPDKAAAEETATRLYASMVGGVPIGPFSKTVVADQGSQGGLLSA